MKRRPQQPALAPVEDRPHIQEHRLGRRRQIRDDVEQSPLLQHKQPVRFTRSEATPTGLEKVNPPNAGSVAYPYAGGSSGSFSVVFAERFRPDAEAVAIAVNSEGSQVHPARIQSAAFL